MTCSVNPLLHHFLRHYQEGKEWPEVVQILVNRPYGLYPSVLQLFWAGFYHAGADSLEVYRVASSNHALMVTSDIIIDMVDIPANYAVFYRPLTEPQRKFLRGLVDRALGLSRNYSLQTGEGISLRGHVAHQLRFWAKQVPSATRQASLIEIGRILQGVSTEILSACIALIETAFLPSETQVISALTETLPIRLGLPPDSTQWTEAQVDQALAYAESACQELQQFPKTFESYLAWQVGQLFGLVESPKNPNESLQAALKWRKDTAGIVHRTHLVGAPDARDLLDVLDDKPHNFEQAFLNALAFRWKLKVFSEWDGIRVGDQLLQRLEEAKRKAEDKVAELHPVESPVKPAEPRSERVSERVITPPSPIEQPPRFASGDTQVSGPRRDGSPTTTEDPPTSTPKPVKIASLNTPSEETSLVRQAFVEIQAIMDRLPSRDQITLWKLLVEEYDPR